MKHVITICTGMLLAAVGAALIVRQATGHSHLSEIVAATAITLISALLSMVPLMVLRRSSPVVMFQAAFGGTVLHLFLTIAMGAAVYALRPLGDRNLFLFLLLASYWVSLIFMVVAMIRVFRRSGIGGTPVQTSTGGAIAQPPLR